MNNSNAGLWGHQQGGIGIVRKECSVEKCVNCSENAHGLVGHRD